MTPRESILARVRARLRKGAEAAAAGREAVAAHLRAHPAAARPRMDWEPVTRFRERARGLASTVDEVETLAAVPGAVARYLKAHSLPSAAVCWAEFAALDWQGAGIEVEAREARGTDLVGITGAFCAIAETGTLMTLSGRDTPAAVSLLPETHVAVVRKSRIVRGMEEAWRLMGNEAGAPPRAVNFIFPQVSPGTHRLEIQFRNAGGSGLVEVGPRMLTVAFAR